MSLDILPVEILNRILDDIDVSSILISFRYVCKRFYDITDNYNRYELDISSMTQTDIWRIERLIPSENIISIVFRGEKSQQHNAGLFFQLLNNHPFSRLRSLTLLEMTSVDLNRVLNALSGSPLVSLCVHASGSQGREIVNLLSSAVPQFQLRKLNLKNFDSAMQNLSWRNLFSIEHINLENCTLSQYQTMLCHLPNLKTSVMRDCLIDNRNEMVVASYPQLLSLTINDCHLSISDILFVISQTPSLTCLKLISSREAYDSTFNGFFWEEFFRSNFSSLGKFEFCFSHTLRQNSFMIDIDSLFNSFRTVSFRPHNIICDYNIQQRMINLYNIPMTISRDTLTIRWRISSMDVTSPPILNYSSVMPITEIELRSHHIDTNLIKHLALAIQTNNVSNDLINELES